jgi:hypothetical protein
MNQFAFAAQFDGTANAGRKGIAYDWRSLVARSGAAIDAELTELVRTSLVSGSAE